MNIFTIILLLVAGTFMVLLEILVLPGLVIGVIGAGLYFWGIYEAFQVLGTNWGWSILITTILIDGALIWYLFRNIYRTRFAMKHEIDSRVNELEDFGLETGDEGITITDLRPEGKAIFDNDTVIVCSSDGSFLPSNVKIEVVKIAENKIYVNQI